MTPSCHSHTTGTCWIPCGAGPSFSRARRSQSLHGLRGACSSVLPTAFWPGAKALFEDLGPKGVYIAARVGRGSRSTGLWPSSGCR